MLGDAANLPTSKAGSVAHFASDILFENLINNIEGRPMTAKFDGHTNCYIETGYGKGALIDFNYDTEPLPGTFPLPGIGPFGLLKNTKINHYSKVMFRWMYWHILLKGKELSVEPLISMAGKKVVSSDDITVKYTTVKYTVVNDSTQTQINELNSKMDEVLSYISEQRSRSMAIDDMVSDLSIVGKDIYDTAVDELDKQHVEINPDEVKKLVIKFLRNIDTFTQLLNTMEIITDLLQDVSPLATEAIIDFSKTPSETQ
ncbi:MAG: hypothetical protein ACP5DZ_07720 [Bacteroidales bacterium]